MEPIELFYKIFIAVSVVVFIITFIILTSVFITNRDSIWETLKDSYNGVYGDWPYSFIRSTIIFIFIWLVILCFNILF